MTKEQFVALLTAACPETVPILDEHLSDNDNELLLHLLMADTRRFCIDRFEAGDGEVLSRCLDALAKGLTDGDEYVDNAVAVCFVEDTGLWDPLMEPFIATWPAPLREEAERQRNWRPDHS